eukprot:2139873-Pyramimonas_sp.AAC.6
MQKGWLRNYVKALGGPISTRTSGVRSLLMDPGLGGEIFVDGLSLRHRISDLARAGLTVSLLGPSCSEETIRARGPARPPDPQTPQSAAFHAFCAAIRFTARAPAVHSDC